MESIDPATLHPVLPSLLQKLGSLGAQRIILYGSRARGDHAPRSDFDLAIDAPDLSEKQWWAMQDVMDNAETLYKIDLVWLQRVSDDLRRNIQWDGKILADK